MAQRNGRGSRLILLLLFFFPVPASAYSRIVSLKPNITEILFALGSGPQIIGVTQFCDRPAEAKALPKIADYIRVDAEKVLRLKPDLVLGSTENSSQKEVFFLMDRGVNVKLYDFSTLPEILRSIAAIGKELGKSQESQAIVDKMQRELDVLKAKSAAMPKPRVLFAVGSNPMVVAGSNNFFNESTEYIGAVNVAAASKLKYATYSTELLIRAAPDVVFELTMGSEKTSATEQERLAWWRQFRSIPAVQNGKIYFLDISRMRAVPSLPEFLQELFGLLHPTG